jgi:oligopeptide transport system permease protein
MSAALNTEAGRSLWQDSWARLRRNRLAVACGLIFIAITLACFLGPMLLGLDAASQNLELKATPPSAQHWFGTDALGRDLFARVLTGGQVSLQVAFVATTVAILIGVAYGATAGYLGGRIDATMMRFVDILYALPFMIFVILLMVMFGQKLILMYLAIGAVEWLTMARIVRGQVLGLAKQEFVEAARSLGLSDARIIFRHIVPNVLGPVIVYATLTIPAVMLLEAALSFLGLGVKPPDASWGTLIDDGAANMETYPWLLGFPALFFSASLFCLNFIGDGLRDALDVRTSKD